MGHREGCGDNTEVTRALLEMPGNCGDNAGDQGPPWAQGGLWGQRRGDWGLPCGTGRTVRTTQG